MKMLSLLLFLSFSTSLFGQYFAEPGSKWSYKIIDLVTGPPAPDRYVEIFEVHEKIEFAGKMASVITLNRGHCDSSINDEVEYVAYEEGKVYLYNWTTEVWMVLYNFNAEAGDKWVMKLDNYCTIEIKIDSVGMEVISGDTLKVLYVADNNGYEFPGEKIYERLGGSFYLFPNPFHSSCDIICDGPSVVLGLRCYEDSLIQYRSIDDTEDCYEVLSSVTKPILTNDFSIYPNPTAGTIRLNGEFIINNGITAILIKNINGQQVYASDYSNSLDIDLSHLQSGVYTLMATSKSGDIAVRQFVKL